MRIPPRHIIHINLIDRHNEVLKLLDWHAFFATITISFIFTASFLKNSATLQLFGSLMMTMAILIAFSARNGTISTLHGLFRFLILFISLISLFIPSSFIAPRNQFFRIGLLILGNIQILMGIYLHENPTIRIIQVFSCTLCIVFYVNAAPKKKEID